MFEIRVVVELQIRTGRGIEWADDVMPTQVYAYQGSGVTVDGNKKHVLGNVPSGALVTPHMFQRETNSLENFSAPGSLSFGF